MHGGKAVRTLAHEIEASGMATVFTGCRWGTWEGGAANHG